MTQNPKGTRDQAEVQFQKAQRKQDGENALSEYEAAGRAEREKTARLRALRLAKEAADKNEAGPAVNPAVKKKVIKSGRKNAEKSSLSQWLADEQKAGRRS